MPRSADRPRRRRQGPAGPPDAVRRLGLLERDAADRRASLGLDRRLALGAPAPVREDEARRRLRAGLQLVEARGRGRSRLPERERALVEVGLDLDRASVAPAAAGSSASGVERLLAGVAPDEHRLRLLDVARADLEPERHAPQLPLVELPAGRLVGPVDLDADAGAERASSAPTRPRRDTASLVLRLRARDRDDHHLDRRDPRRQDQAGVVAVDHDERADHAGRDAPARRPDVLALAVHVLEGDVERLGEVLAEVVGRADCSALPSGIIASME